MKEKIFNRKFLKEFFLYGIIGVSTASLDIILFKLLTMLNLNIFIANFLSVNTAITLSFIFNAKFNFKKTDNLLKRGIKFFSVGYVGLLISYLLLFIGTKIFFFDEMIVKIVSVIIVAMIQYILNKFITFRK